MVRLVNAHNEAATEALVDEGGAVEALLRFAQSEAEIAPVRTAASYAVGTLAQSALVAKRQEAQQAAALAERLARSREQRRVDAAAAAAALGASAPGAGSRPSSAVRRSQQQQQQQQYYHGGAGGGAGAGAGVGAGAGAGSSGRGTPRRGATLPPVHGAAVTVITGSPRRPPSAGVRLSDSASDNRSHARARTQDMLERALAAASKPRGKARKGTPSSKQGAATTGPAIIPAPHLS